MPVRRNPEQTIIGQVRTLFIQGRDRRVPLGIGDDCAILRPPADHDLLVTTDFSLEERHFRRATHPAPAVGHRTLARGLSDLAAMGADPLAAFLSLALPAGLPTTAAGRRWIAGFLEGLHALAAEWKVPLAGGDTAQSPTGLVLADIVLLGTAPRGQALRRSTAQPGDRLYVTGTLGGAAAELRDLLAYGKARRAGGQRSDHPHLYPQPRVAVGLRLRGRATACIDLSDGLATDLGHLCASSGVRAELQAEAIPVHPGATLEDALHGGEDYELLFAASANVRMPRKLAGVPVTPIGTLFHRTGRQLLITLLAEGRRPQALRPMPHHFR